jgi:hypothetical protein
VHPQPRRIQHAGFGGDEEYFGQVGTPDG